MKSNWFLLKIVILILMVVITQKVFGQVSNTSSNDNASQLEKKGYFLHVNYEVQLENHLGTEALIFDIPGKSAKEIYLACIEILRNYKNIDKIEFIENKSIDLYFSKEIRYNVQIGYYIPYSVFFYNYMVRCDDGKLTIENPYIYTKIEDYMPVADFIVAMEEYSAKDKSSKKIKASNDEMRAFVSAKIKAGYHDLIEEFDKLNDSLLMRINEGQKLDSLEWIADKYALSFELTLDGLTSRSNRNYMVVVNPSLNFDDLKNKTKALFNFIRMELPIEYYFKIIGEKYDFYAIRDISAFTVDQYFRTRIIDFDVFSMKYDFGDYQRFTVRDVIISKNKESGLVDFEFDIIYAPGLVRISTPRIIKINEGNEAWMPNPDLHMSIFSSDNKVRHPIIKQSVEDYFNDLFTFLFRYYSEE